jgi:hypothetical protein
MLLKEKKMPGGKKKEGFETSPDFGAIAEKAQKDEMKKTGGRFCKKSKSKAKKIKKEGKAKKTKSK